MKLELSKIYETQLLNNFWLSKISQTLQRLKNYAKDLYDKHPRVIKTIIVFLSVVTILFLLLTLVIRQFDINSFKSNLEARILEETGQNISFHGPISIHSFPRTHFLTEKITLKKGTSKNETIQIEKLKITPQITAFLRGKKALTFEVFDLKLDRHRIPHVKGTLMFLDKELKVVNLVVELTENKKTKMLNLDSMVINYENEEPNFRLQHQGDCSSFPLIFSMLGMKNFIVGEAYIKLDLNANGKKWNRLRSTLCGEVEIEMAHGKIYGVDLIHDLKEAKSAVKTVTPNVSKLFRSLNSVVTRSKPRAIEEITPFHQLKLKGKVDKGIFNAHHFSLSHKFYSVHGKGKVNLRGNHLDCAVRTRYHEPKARKLFKNKDPKNSGFLHLTIKGPFDKLAVKSDLQSYMDYIKN